MEQRLLEGKVVLVVGGGSGIGAAAAVLCAERGARVVVADRDAAAGAAVAARAGRFVAVDVTDEASVTALMESVRATEGRLDALLHTAGVLRGAFVPLEQFTLETWRSVIDVNVTGSFLCARAAAPLLGATGRGVIVLVSSGAATGGSSSFAYGTSKGGVNSLAIVLANALGPRGIRVNVVSPGNIDTAMKRSVIAADVERAGGKAAGQELESAVRASGLGSPEGVARVLAWLASDDADYVRGSITTR